MLAHVADTIRPLFARMLAVGIEGPIPECPDVEAVPDAIPGAGPLGGIYTGLRHARTEYSFFFACDAPLISIPLARHIISCATDADAAVPASGAHHQPLFAIYSKRCLEPVSEQLKQGNYKISGIYSRLRVRRVDEAEQIRFDPQLLSFVNINTPEDYERALELRGAWIGQNRTRLRAHGCAP